MLGSYSQEFKSASIGLLLNIIQNRDLKKSKKYYNFFAKEFSINTKELEELIEIKSFEQAHSKNIDIDIDIIRDSLGNKQHQIMKFLMILNRCIVIDGCDVQSYQRFEKVRDNFIKKL